MKVLVTGGAGRVGRAVVDALRPGHEVVTLDRVASPGLDWQADLGDAAVLRRALRGVQAVVHTAALHAPHVGVLPDTEFQRINVDATAQLARRALDAGALRFLFTSSTALYGAGPQADGAAAWVDEDTVPQPRTVYHRSKLAAEAALAELTPQGLAVTVLRMGRCFPEPAPLMAVYRLHRGVDVRDVADAHRRALEVAAPGWRCFVVSGATPFRRDDAAALGRDAAAVLQRRVPALAAAFAHRGWPLPTAIDRVYDPARAMAQLGWQPQHGFEAVLAQLEAGDAAVRPAT